MNKIELITYAKKFSQGKSPADALFEHHKDSLNTLIIQEIDRLHYDKKWPNEVAKAAEILNIWASSGRKQNYTPDDLASKFVARKIANKYQDENREQLMIADALHQAVIAYSILESGLSELMIEQGNQGRKLGVLEVTARLSPILSFSGSSKCFEIGVIPYGKESHTALGEKPTESFVSEQAVIESALNLKTRFNLNYVLAETSIAPRTDVPKSRRSPEIHIARLVDNKMVTTHDFIETPFRQDFNANVRELMFIALRDMYLNKM
jgi:nicotinamide mononucleotide (NMN) deamidase PncC